MGRSSSDRLIGIKLSGVLETRGDWEVAISGCDDPEFTFAVGAVKQSRDGTWELPRTSHDISNVRKKLFRVDDAEGALAFLREFGPVSVDRPLGMRADPVRLSSLLALRDLRREFLTRKTTAGEIRKSGLRKDGLLTFSALYDFAAHTPPPVSLFRANDQVIGKVQCKDIAEATHASVYLDRLDGFDWAECEKCGDLYKPVSKHARKYCSERCTNAARAALRHEKMGGSVPKWLEKARAKHRLQNSRQRKTS